MTAAAASPGRGRPASILRKIVMMSCLVGALSVLVYSVFVMAHHREVSMQRLTAQGERLAQVARLKCGRALGDENYALVVELCSDLMDDEPDLEVLALKGARGEVLVFAREGWNRMSEPDYIKRTSEAGLGYSDPWWEVLSGRGGLAASERQPVHAAAGEIGWVEVVVNSSDGTSGFSETYALTGRVGGVTLCLGTILSFFFARNLTRPVRQLQEYAQRVASGSLTARVDIDTDDEIGDLAESIMRMVRNLDVSQRQLKDSMRSAAALREKEVLLREIHHRVKNNMQILTSLLRLQTRRAETPEMADLLRDSEARIRSMGLLHEKLYQSDNVSLIDLKSYLETLTAELSKMGASQGRAEIQVAAHQIKLGLDTALPCGLIVTELVSNALKYAFPEDSDDARVVVSVGKVADREYSLVVWDNGCGISPELDIRACESLGLRLVSLLTDQLNGELNVDGSQGTRVEVRFKESEYTKRY